MIKRLKWNVLHADDDDDPGQLSSSSDESDQELPPEAALQVLMENDPQLNPSANARAVLQSKELRILARSQSRKRKRASDDKLEQSSSSSDEEPDFALHSDEDEEEQQQTAATQSNEQSVQDMGHGFYEWQECLLCPGKKFYTQQTLNEHLQSKKHLKALQKQNVLNQQPLANTDKKESQTIEAPETGEEQHAERDKRHSTARATSSALLTPSKIRSMRRQNSATLDKDLQVLSVNEASTVQDNDNNMREEQRRETQEEEARRREKRKKDAAKRKLKALKRRKWEKRNNDKAVPKAGTPCK